eukprot:8152_1
MPTTATPTDIPTAMPTTATPTTIPSSTPSITPTTVPSTMPTATPSITPTSAPITTPTEYASVSTTISMETTPIIHTINPISTTLYTTTTALLSTFESTHYQSTTENTIRSTESPYDSGEVSEKTTMIPTWMSTKNTSASAAPWSINLDSIMGFIALSGILLFGLICFVMGLCIGIAIYRRNVNDDEDPDDDKRSIKSDLANQMANNERQSPSVEVIAIDIQPQMNGDTVANNESLYNAFSPPANTQPHPFHEQELSPSLPIPAPPPVPVVERRETADGESSVLNIFLEPNDASMQRIKPVVQDNASVSVNYADADEEKENRLIKTRTPGQQQGAVKQYGIVQPDVFPDDEGSVQPVDVGVESEKAIEMQQRMQKEMDDKYFRLMKKVMLDEEASDMCDVEDDRIG